MESEDREGREGRGRTKGFGTRAGRRATRRAGRRGSRRGRLNLTFKKKEKRRKAHIGRRGRSGREEKKGPHRGPRFSYENNIQKISTLSSVLRHF